MSDDEIVDYGFEYSDEEVEEEDVDIENAYYNAKGALEGDDPEEALQGFAKARDGERGAAFRVPNMFLTERRRGGGGGACIFLVGWWAPPRRPPFLRRRGSVISTSSLPVRPPPSLDPLSLGLRPSRRADPAARLSPTNERVYT